MNASPAPSKKTQNRYPVIPLIQERAMSECRPYVAEAQHQQRLGYPGSLVDDWQQVAIKRLGELVHSRRGLRVFLDTCTRCGACTDKCHYFLGTGDPKNMPVARQDLLRKVYQRYFTWAGRWFPRWVGAVDLTEEVLQDWYTYYHQCSECRRCAVYCPKGIDTAEVTMAGREILSTVGLGQNYTQQIIGKVFDTGNNLGMRRPALQQILESLEEDLVEETGLPIRLPLDEPDAELMLVVPSADFYAEPHIDGLIGAAKVLHQAGVRWTLSSAASEAANFGLFSGNMPALTAIALNIYQAAAELRAGRVVIGECGHAWRVAYSYWEPLIGPLKHAGATHSRPAHICEITWELLRSGALVLDPSRNDHRRVTYHDSCNVARGSGMGNFADGPYDIPRQLLRAACNHFFDMRANTIRQQTFCCGGGGGLLTDEQLELRIKGAKPRMQALEQVVEQHGVTHLATICAICKTQFSTVLPHFGHASDAVISLHQLIGDALVLQPVSPARSDAHAD